MPFLIFLIYLFIYLFFNFSAMNFGGIAFVVGHELTHAFDSSGLFPMTLSSCAIYFKKLHWGLLFFHRFSLVYFVAVTDLGRMITATKRQWNFASCPHDLTPNFNRIWSCATCPRPRWKIFCRDDEDQVSFLFKRLAHEGNCLRDVSLWRFLASCTSLSVLLLLWWN